MIWGMFNGTSVDTASVNIGSEHSDSIRLTLAALTRFVLCIAGPVQRPPPVLMWSRCPSGTRRRCFL